MHVKTEISTRESTISKRGIVTVEYDVAVTLCVFHSELLPELPILGRYIFPDCTSSVDCWKIPGCENIHVLMRMGVLRRVLELHKGDKVTGYRQLIMVSKAGMDFTRTIRGHDLDTTVLASKH